MRWVVAGSTIYQKKIIFSTKAAFLLHFSQFAQWFEVVQKVPFKYHLENETYWVIFNHCVQESNRLFFQMSNRWGSNKQEKGSKLNLRNTKRTDTGQYTCVASNGIGQPATSQITLRVQCKYPSSLSWLSEMMQAGASVVAAAEAIFINAFPSPL